VVFSTPVHTLTQTGRYVLPETIFFDSARARVKSGGRRILRRIVSQLGQRGDWTELHVEGHADLRGPDAYNDWLSTERAQRVARVLAELGIDSEKIQVHGFGRKRPIASTTSVKDHQANRRVELVLLTTQPATADRGAP
jgi:outer membrane protein OmpA-like peptidoglycan-associated protein